MDAAWRVNLWPRESLMKAAWGKSSIAYAGQAPARDSTASTVPPGKATMVRPAWLILLAVATLGCASCGKQGPAKKVCYPTKGELSVKGQPAPGAVVILHPKGNMDNADW